MAAITYDHLFGIEMCEALGFDPAKVIALKIEFEEGRGASVTLRLIPDEKELQGIEERIRNYRLVSAEGMPCPTI